MTKDKAQVDRTARIKVPLAEKEFWEWFDAQERPTASIRVLVAREIAQNGIQDTFWTQAFEPKAASKEN